MNPETVAVLGPMIEAHAQGRIVQVRYGPDEHQWMDCPEPTWDRAPQMYRLKDEVPVFEWHPHRHTHMWE